MVTYTIELGAEHVRPAGHTGQRPTEDGLALAVVGGGVDQVDAEVESAAHHAGRLRLRHAAALPEPAFAAGADADDRHLQAGAP